MTVSSSARKAGPFTGNDVSTVFAFPFKVFADDEIAVYKSNTLGIESLLTEGIDYSSSVNPNQDLSPGGSITTFVPLATGETLVIIGSTPMTQGLSLVNGATMYPKNIETALDRLVCMIQQNAEDIARAVMVDVTSETSPSELIAGLISAAASAAEDAATASAAGASASASAAALAAIKDYSILAGAGGRFAVVAGVIRQSSALGGWTFISDANHSPVNCSTVYVDANGDINIDFARTFSKKSGFIVGVDETFASYGISIGASVGNDSCLFQMYAPLGGPITASGIEDVTPLGHFSSGSCSQALTASAGTLSVTHPSIPHSSGYGGAVMVSDVNNHSRWVVSSSSKTGFTLTYTKQVSGFVNWSGGFPLLNTDIAYPSALTIASGANNGSGLYRLTFTAPHSFITGQRATISGTGTALDSGDAATSRSWEVTVINSTTVDLVGSTYSTPIASGSAAFTQVDWVTDHLEIFHPTTGSNQPAQVSQWKSTTQYHIAADSSHSGKILVYFYALTTGTQVTTKSSQMKITYDRAVFLPATIPATVVGRVQRDLVHCHADYVYGANANIWFIGIFEE